MKKVTSHPLFWSSAISIFAFAAVFLELGVAALFLVVVLSILEVTLSFDNAVITQGSKIGRLAYPQLVSYTLILSH